MSAAASRPAYALAAMLLLAAGCGSPAPSGGTPTPAPSPAGSRPPTATPLPIAFNGHATKNNPIRLKELKGRRVLYSVTADAMHGHYAGIDTGTSDLTNPHITFYGENARELTAAAPAGTVREKDKSVVMTGGVHARSQDGMTLQSDTLRYNDTSEIAHAAGHVVVTSPRGERLDGDNAQWNLRTGDIEMNSGTP